MPVPPQRPAVWQRPQQVDPDRTARGPTAVAAPALPEAPTPPPAPRAPPAPPAPPPAAHDVVHPAQQTEPVRPHPRGFAPQPFAFAAHGPSGETTVKDWPPPAHAGGDPDWLTERLARETATHGGREWNGAWKRRLASWGAAGVLLALLAGGGLWLYEQSRVEGALVVVANTNPVPEGSTVRPGSGAALSAVTASPSAVSPPVASPSAANPSAANSSVASADKNAAVLAPVSAMPCYNGIH
jgi:hypothetical protein